MIFYLAVDSQGFRQLLTRKDEAGRLDPDYKTLDIEPNKDAMQIALQELLTEADKLQQIVDQVPKGTATVQVPKPSIPLAPKEKDAVYPEKRRTTDQIIDWIFDEAPVHQVSEILSALGSRLAEIAAKDQGRSL